MYLVAAAMHRSERGRSDQEQNLELKRREEAWFMKIQHEVVGHRKHMTFLVANLLRIS